MPCGQPATVTIEQESFRLIQYSRGLYPLTSMNIVGWSSVAPQNHYLFPWSEETECDPFGTVNHQWRSHVFSRLAASFFSN